MNLNKAMIIGNLTRDPEIRNTPSGQNVASFAVATSYTWNDQAGQKQEKVEFHNIVAWRRLADIIGQYLKKGSKVYIEGRLQTRDWVGQDGVKRYRTEIIADNMIMLGGNPAGNRPFGQAGPAPAASYNQGASNISEPVIDASQPVEPNPEEDEIRVENIPF